MGAGLLLLLQGCRLSGESRNPRIPNPQGQKVNSSLRATPQMSSFRRKPESTYPQPSGTAGQSILRATPQMSSFRRKPESTYPQPSGTAGQSILRATPQMSSSGESRNPRTLNPEVRQVDATYPQPRQRILRATPQMSSSGESRNPRTLNPEVRQVDASLPATPEVAEAHSRQSIKRIPPYSMPLRQLAGVQTRGTTWIPAFAGMTEGMTSSLQGQDDVGHLSERWPTRSPSFVIPARNPGMTPGQTPGVGG